MGRSRNPSGGDLLKRTAVDFDWVKVVHSQYPEFSKMIPVLLVLLMTCPDTRYQTLPMESINSPAGYKHHVL